MGPALTFNTAGWMPLPGLGLLGFCFGLLFGLFGFLRLLAFVLFLAQLGGELVAALVALAAQAEASPGGAFGRGRFFKQQLEEDQRAAVADAVVGELDDAGVAAVAPVELGRDVIKQLLHHGLACEF